MHALSSRTSPIPDCDEVFNYWEPLHFLIYGSGMQTWEYSPEFALRSYYFLLLHWPFAYLFSVFSKAVAFWLTRACLGLVCALCQHYCIQGLKPFVSQEQIKLNYTIYVVSTGFFLAANTFLPSTFAMNCLSLALGSYLRYLEFRQHRYLFLAVLAAAHSVVVGWPFAVVVIGLFTLTAVFAKPKCLKDPKLYMSALAALALTVVPSFLADWWFYGRPTLATFNVIIYNTSLGSNLVGASVLYGVEPWTFYFKNLFLNFNLAFVLALVSPVLLLFKSTPNRTLLGCIVAGFFGWFVLMTSQPHKEERFMYVIYPALCILAAWVLTACKSVVKALILVTFCVLSILRSAQQTRGFFAPLSVWNQPTSGKVCVGREWYRFPSSYFIRDVAELAFYEDGFTGQLPQPFTETSSVSSHFNAFNIEEKSRYVPLEACDYIIDVDLPSAPMREELRSWVSFRQDVVYKMPFLDSAATPQPFRSLYIPGSRTVFGEYLLLKRNK